MDWYVKAFLKASLSWLSLGVTVGVAMAAHPAWVVYRPMHLHMLVFGFVTMMIFGVAYHVIPRFAGHPLYSTRAAEWNWWASNVGLLLMVAGFALRPSGSPLGTPVLATGGMLAALGAYTFAYVVWRTIDGPAALRAAAQRAREVAARSPRAELPVAPSQKEGAPLKEVAKR